MAELSINPEPQRTAAEASIAFGLALYKELAAGEGNLFFAPASITASLAMAWVGSSGETATELARALCLPQDRLALRATLRTLFYQATDPPGCELSTANALWIQERYPLLPEYLEFVRGRFGATVEQANFTRAAEEACQAINAWVAAQTKGHICDVITPASLDALARLVLVNAIYFKGAWAEPFDPRSTQPKPFHRAGKASVDVPMMYQQGSYRLLELDGLQVLELPYRGGTLAMLVLLPSALDGLLELQRNLAAAPMQQVFEQLERAPFRQVKVYLPRFRIEAQFGLSEALQRLGAQRAFDTRADFSGMTTHPEGLYIAAVLHRALVEVGEEGTVAAAATAVVYAMKSAERPPPVPMFRADHPFLFLIRDTRSGMVLFLGCLADPSA